MVLLTQLVSPQVYVQEQVSDLQDARLWLLLCENQVLCQSFQTPLLPVFILHQGVAHP